MCPFRAYLNTTIRTFQNTISGVFVVCDLITHERRLGSGDTGGQA